jgi:hypothetical protein
MSTLLPYLVILIFAAAQICFALLLKQKQRVTIKTVDVNMRGIDQWLTARYGGKPLQQQIDQLTQATTDQQQYAEYLDTRLTAVLDEVCAVKQNLHDEELKTQQRISQVKTWLADEERGDQAARRKAHLKKAKV